MSVRIITEAWAVDLPAGEKLVLLALADCANDEGHCWPGIKNLCTKTGKSERSLQGAIKALCETGHLSRTEVLGKGCNYTVHPRSSCTPAKSAPPQKTAQTPAKSAGKPSVTVISSEAKASSPRARFSAPDGVTEDQWKAFRAQRKKALNDRSYILLTNKLRNLAEDGWPPGDMIDLAIERGWETVFSPRNDNGQQRTNTVGRHQPNDGLSSTARAALAVFGSGHQRTVPQ